MKSSALLLIWLTSLFVFQIKGQNFERFNTLINTSYNDLHPTISPTGDTLVFVSNRFSNNSFKVSHQLLIACKDSTGAWQKAKRLYLEEDFENIEFPAFTNNGKALYFSAQKKEDENANLWVIHPKDSSWTAPQLLSAAINTEAWEASPATSTQGNRLFFIRYDTSKEIPGVGYCGKIWVANQKNNTTWSEPALLPDAINAYCVHSLCILPSEPSSPDEKLIFTAERENGKGGLDFYETQLQRNGTWTSPRLLDRWSTTANESSVSLTRNQKILYIANDRIKNSQLSNWNIYEIRANQLKSEPKMVKVYGSITDFETKEPVVGKFEIMRINENEEEVIPLQTDEQGNYQIELLDTKLYFLKVQSATHESFGYLLDLSNLENVDVIRYDVRLNRRFELMAEGETMVMFNDVQFAYNSADLQPQALNALDKVVTYLLSNPGISMEISAHTDNEGTKENNLLLSEKRAESVKAYLIQQGIEANRLSTKAFGDTRPLFDNLSPKAKAANRRVEFRVK